MRFCLGSVFRAEYKVKVIPCYVDVFYPEVGIATLELLEKLGIEVEYPFDQTCCGQPMANSGCEADARATEELFIRNFSVFEYIVIPSGSCTHHIRNKFIAAPPSPERDHVQSHVYDPVEFFTTRQSKGISLGYISA